MQRHALAAFSGLAGRARTGTLDALSAVVSRR